MGDLFVRLPPDFRAGGFVVGPPVGVVVVLVGVEKVLRIFIDQTPNHALRAVGALLRVGEDKLRTIRLERLLTLWAGVSRKREGDAIAALGGDHRVRDSG